LETVSALTPHVHHREIEMRISGPEVGFDESHITPVLSDAVTQKQNTISIGKPQSLLRCSRPRLKRGNQDKNQDEHTMKDASLPVGESSKHGMLMTNRCLVDKFLLISIGHAEYGRCDHLERTVRNVYPLKNQAPRMHIDGWYCTCHRYKTQPVL
jgi:hypothetical protein